MSQPLNKRLVTEAQLNTRLASLTITNLTVSGTVSVPDGSLTQSDIAGLPNIVANKVPLVPIYCPGDVDKPRVNLDGSALVTGQHAEFIKKTAPTNAQVDDRWTVRDF